MVYYTEEPHGVNKRMVAGYYLFLCLIGFAILLGPTGSGITITNVFSDRVREAHELATPNLEDGASCLDGGCHSTTWDYWNMTTHSGYLVYYNETSGTVTVNGHRERTYEEFNASCAQCHAIGWTPERNVTDWPNTHDGFGTNCFSCHSDVAPYYSVNGSNCASCHVHDGHGGVVGYTESAHANSLTDLRASGHAGSSCMHCMSVEGFLDQETDFDPEGDYNPLTCPACHSVHDENIVNPAMIRAENSTELCGLCHGTSSRHTTIEVWVTGPHYLTGIVECVDCHGFQQGDHGPFVNHTFFIQNATETCGQSAECHEGQEEWAITQMEEITTAFSELVSDFSDEADAFETVVLAYNATAGANQTLVNYVLGVMDDASGVVAYYGYDSSSGFHSPMLAFDDINSAFRDLLNAEAYYYENLPAPAAGFSADTLIIVGGAAGGIVVGLLLGVLVGRRR